MHLLQCPHEHFLPVREEVRIDVHRRGDVLVSDALRDGHRREALIDEQGDMCIMF